MNLIFSEIYWGMNDSESLAKFTWTSSFTLHATHCCRTSMNFEKKNKNKIHFLNGLVYILWQHEISDNKFKMCHHYANATWC